VELSRLKREAKAKLQGGEKTYKPKIVKMSEFNADEQSAEDDADGELMG
jgi:hypothetical protein